MARDAGLEEIIRDYVADRGLRGLAEKPMFGGLAWLMRGNLVLGAREDSLLVRLGKDHDAWALKTAGIERMVLGKRTMLGWVRASSKAYGKDALREKLLDAAFDFARSLPAK